MLMLEHDGKPAYTILPFNFTYLNKAIDICELTIHKKEISAVDVCLFQIFIRKNNYHYFMYKDGFFLFNKSKFAIMTKKCAVVVIS